MWSITGLDTIKDPIDYTLHYSKIEPNAGAPVHNRAVDELATILDGCLEVSIEEKKQILVANQTMVIPKGKAHGFKGIGPETTATLAFFPSKNRSQATIYLEGLPPAIYRKQLSSSFDCLSEDKSHKLTILPQNGLFGVVLANIILN